jgi:hypothetical protein
MERMVNEETIQCHIWDRLYFDDACTALLERQIAYHCTNKSGWQAAGYLFAIAFAGRKEYVAWQAIP